MQDSIALQNDALRLSELNRLSIKALIESNLNDLQEYLNEYIEIKKRIKNNLIDNPTTQIHNHKALEILQQISENKPFHADNVISALEDMENSPGKFTSLTEDEIEELGSQKFYSWFSHYEYIEGHYEIGSLILGISIPQNLRSFVSEAKECYAFQQYNAVYSLCRTILEASVKLICEKRGLLRDRTGNVKPIEDYRWSDLMHRVSRGTLRDNLDRIYNKTSILIHGRKTISSKEARETFRETLRVVHDLFKFNRF